MRVLFSLHSRRSHYNPAPADPNTRVANITINEKAYVAA